MYLTPKSINFARLFFLVSLSGFFTYIILALYTFHTAYSTISELHKIENQIKHIDLADNFDRERFSKDLKYILIWTSWNAEPMKQLAEGQAVFIDQKCPDINCFITNNRGLLDGDYTLFDAILFNSISIQKWKPMLFPKRRSIFQKYVFVSKESAEKYPVCDINSENYFNWTWTYKLNSDIVSPFIEISDLSNKVIGPKLNMTWINKETEISSDFKRKLGTKTKAAIWVTTQCITRNNRLHYIKTLKNKLKENGLVLDIYGPCGSSACPNNDINNCYRMIKKNYFFYIAFEDSFTEDYVTEEVLIALRNNAVPVVFGSKDYSNFLPPGSYIAIDTRDPGNIATHIEYAIKNPSVYYKYFSWRNLYTYKEAGGLGNVCQLCSMLNNEEVYSKTTVYEFFRSWWYSEPLRDRCYPTQPIIQKYNESRPNYMRV